jgi:hypothetical protein
VEDPAKGQPTTSPLDAVGRSRSNGPTNALGDAWRFARDVVWLLGWGFNRIASTASAAARSPEGRGSIGCLASAGALLTGLMFWRRRRAARRQIRRVSPTRVHSDAGGKFSKK